MALQKVMNVESSGIMCQPKRTNHQVLTMQLDAADVQLLMCDGSRTPSMRSISIKTWCLLCLRHSQTQLHSLSLTVQEYPKGLCPNVVSDALNLDLSRDCRLTLPS